MADAEASFSTDIDSTSFGLMSLMEPSKGEPSTTMSGLELALMEPTPRMRMVGPPLVGSPDPEITWTPGEVPASALVTFVETFFSMASLLTIAADPVKELFVDVPYAMTMASSMNSWLGASAALITAFPSMATSRFS